MPGGRKRRTERPTCVQAPMNWTTFLCRTLRMMATSCSTAQRSRAQRSRQGTACSAQQRPAWGARPAEGRACAQAPAKPSCCPAPAGHANPSKPLTRVLTPFPQPAPKCHWPTRSSCRPRACRNSWYCCESVCTFRSILIATSCSTRTRRSARAQPARRAFAWGALTNAPAPQPRQGSAGPAISCTL